MANSLDKFRKGVAQWSGNIGSAGISDAVVKTVPLASTSGLPTDTAVMITVNRVDPNGKKTGNYEGIVGVVSGSNLIDCIRGVEGTAQAWTGGTVVEVLHTADNLNDLIDGILAEHNQDGTHKDTVFTNSLAYQCIINGGFTVNQRGYVSNATLAAGVYGHDRWKAGAGGGDYTFTQLAQATTITIKTGKSLIQVIEDKNVIGGTYTLSWTGTAQARFGIDSATPSGDYAASPITITTQTAGTVMSVEFNAGTLSNVVLNSGTVALPFMPKSYEEELRACQRYCYQVGSDNTYTVYALGLNESSTVSSGVINFPVSMRVNPTLETTATATDYRVTVTNCSSLPAIANTTQNKNLVYVQFTVASGLSSGQFGKLQNNGTAAYLRFVAEL